ncbi:bifunctional [glutamine synthetase] adenylyltransferase/[glutamine synthetase]-adenylyl-L-tyrosine phosphorylase [Streptacidiphilus sp. P02-A3a]|uniref:bifunctional [glutamine synthetase] adenylyltransferase/[glutamine synthetase]-adenylyl-L-tyrosine phosphorylase n=1 Tax=Streptacidiphilus sp. P02-A3a TaxID=2704468 RepID=UPI0015F819A0|nr:bifunctional [glutamine synthetase] adenylyltransferase/[glutamine synthetase]-adenylyl-L-tyrosine phosphorylase [Streptacidiphilus sp. P02-A3a]QMU68421.1 bifunctional [glutamine synthetase] adenylyltransferase/[glutamine synthetase]-adenylyl-L-tyrosine phosphorylase [Streptacidiphilus sp. P02-A3a]
MTGDSGPGAAAPGSGTRRSNPAGRLARRGFTDPEAAVRRLAEPALAQHSGDSVLIDALAATADPDLALLGLARVAEACSDADRRTLLDTLTTSKPLRDRLLGVLGASAALGDHLARHPHDWHALVTFEIRDIHPGPEEFLRALYAHIWEDPAAGDRADALRTGYRRCLLGIAARDLTGTTGIGQTAAELADLAGATLQAALDIALEEDPAAAKACRLAVIAMGKCGGHELNYVSDVDVVFVAEPRGQADSGEPDADGSAVRAATRLAARLMRLCSDTTREGTIWPVDANLRPEGKNGPLVRTLGSHLAYYQRWAKTWEFQALLKARPVAGDAELGRAYLDAVTPLVWHAAERENFVQDVQQMRERVIDAIPAAEIDRELKLGPGGLRDVEFSVQLLQLVHGRADETLRSPNTLTALADLSAGGYVGRADAASLDQAYRFLRSMEHRIQLFQLRRTHLVPTGAEDLRRLGRSLGLRADPVAELTKEWRRHAREVRRLHEKLFYRPLLDAVARLGADESVLADDLGGPEGGAPRHGGLSAEAARTRLAALGYRDPADAMRHLQALASGVSRRAALQRTLLPVMLGWFAESADPDAGLLNFRKVSDSLGSTPWYLRLLRDEGATAENLSRILSSGRLAPDLLLRAPEAVALLGDSDGLQPRGHAVLDREIRSAVGRADGAPAAVAAARSVRRRELFRTAAADVLGRLGDSADALTELNTATLAGALRACADAAERAAGEPLPTRLAIIGMGRFGGAELGYGSDADVMFVHDPLPGADEVRAAGAARAVFEEVRRLLQLPSTEPPLLIDADLRPEGRQGPLVRSLASYAAYYRRWSRPWESQALLRARPVAGDERLGGAFTALVDPLRYPADGLDEARLREIRRLKARVETERMPRGADPTTHTKLGPGGLADVEWTVQLLQLQYGHRVEGLRTTRTRAALAAAVAAGLVDPDAAAELDTAWVRAGRVRNAVMLVRGRPGDSFPGDPRELAGVARYLGYGSRHAGEMVDDYRRCARRARAVVEELFYG